MKKTQRLRLATLEAQTTRTEAEAAELKELQALAIANPDASKDTDDTKAIDAPTFMAKLTAAFTAKAQLATELAAEKAKNATLTQQLADLNAAKPATEQALADANTAKTAAETKFTAASSALNALCSALGLTAEVLTKGDSAAITAAAKSAFETKVNTMATEQLTALGFPSSGLPPVSSSTTGGSETIADLQAQADKEKDPEKAGALVAKIKALRKKAK